MIKTSDINLFDNIENIESTPDVICPFSSNDPESKFATAFTEGSTAYNHAFWYNANQTQDYRYDRFLSTSDSMISFLKSDYENSHRVFRGEYYKSFSDMLVNPILVAVLENKQTVTTNSFLSTSTDVNMARSFSGLRFDISPSYTRVFIVFNQKSGIPVSNISKYEDEKETIIRPNTTFSIMSAIYDTEKDILLIELFETNYDSEAAVTHANELIEKTKEIVAQKPAMTKPEAPQSYNLEASPELKAMIEKIKAKGYWCEDDED